jgi:hypothetical protein
MVFLLYAIVVTSVDKLGKEGNVGPPARGVVGREFTDLACVPNGSTCCRNASSSASGCSSLILYKSLRFFFFNNWAILKF